MIISLKFLLKAFIYAKMVGKVIKVSIVFPFCFIESGTGQRNYYSNPIRSKPEADVLSLKLK